MQRTRALTFSYKGTRRYVHGTDMYDAIMATLQNDDVNLREGAFRMTLHAFARNQCDLVYRADGTPCAKPEHHRTEFSFSDQVHGWLAETERPVTSTNPYPEDAIVDRAPIEGRTISAPGPSGFRPIEVLVALTKKLHIELNPGQRQWAFTRLELVRPLADEDASAFRVELGPTLGNRLTRSAVLAGTDRLGQIYFSAIFA